MENENELPLVGAIGEFVTFVDVSMYRTHARCFVCESSRDGKSQYVEIKTELFWARRCKVSVYGSLEKSFSHWKFFS